MLCFTRKLNETIQISDKVTVTVLSVRGQMVRLGIDAPKECNVVREELLERGATPKKRKPGSSAAAQHSATHRPKSMREADYTPSETAVEPKKPKVIYKRRFRALTNTKPKDT
jgi:carbon storage regulator